MLPTLFLASFAMSTSLNHPEAISFDMKDPKGVTGMTISINAPLEPVRGVANGLSGQIRFNVEHPEQSSGKIVVSTNSLFVGNAGMTKSMLESWCLDSPKYPTIEFEVTKIGKVRTNKMGAMTARVTGNLTLHGVTKSMTVDARIEHYPGKLKARGGVEKDGDLIQVFSKFSINRRDFGIAKDLSSQVIGDVVDIDLAATGVAIK